MSMTAAEFQTAALAIVGTAVGWQTKIARRLDKPVRTIQRWIAADHVPDWAEAQLAELMGGTERSPWPRDEWVIGDGVTADGRPREYLVHLVHPRFSARIVEIDDDGLPLAEHEPADVLAGAVYQVDAGTVLCEVDWVDQPKAGEVVALLEAGAEALAEIDVRLLNETDRTKSGN